MKVLYIGGTGQISFDCVKESVRIGHDVSVFNRGTSKEQLPSEVNIITGSVGDDTYRSLADMDFDVVCQFIAYEPEDVARDVALFKGKVGQYIFISSASAYIKPPYKVMITEDVPLVNPFWDYSQKKADCEAVLRKQNDFAYTIVRPSHTVRFNIPTALSERSVAVYRIRNGIPVVSPGDGTSLWTLTHTRDFAPPFVRLFGRSETIGEAYHLTGDNAYRWDDIYNALGRAIGVDDVKIIHVPSDILVKYNPDWAGGLFGDKMWTSLFDNTKIKSVVGDFKCRIGLDEMMKLVVDEWRARWPDDTGEDKELNKLFDRIIDEQTVRL